MPEIAAKSFIAHLGSRSRRFEKYDEVPDDWAAKVDPVLFLKEDEEPAPEADTNEYPVNGSVDEVLEWVTSGSGDVVKAERARHAYDVERDNKQRSTLIGPLEEILGIDG